MDFLIHFLGWSGVVGLIAAYTASAWGWLSVKDIRLQSANIYAGAALGINAYAFGAVPSAITNTIWVLIAIGSICQTLRRRIR